MEGTLHRAPGGGLIIELEPTDPPPAGPPSLALEPDLEHDRMALKLNGKDERLKRADFLAVSAIAGLRASDAHGAIDEVLERMRAAAAAITLPKLPGYGRSGEAAVTQMLEICRERIASFA